MDFLQKYFYGVFELPLPRNAQKGTKKKSRKNVGWWVGLGFSKCTGGPSIFFSFFSWLPADEDWQLVEFTRRSAYML
jgi:hypothetical protein